MRTENFPLSLNFPAERLCPDVCFHFEMEGIKHFSRKIHAQVVWSFTTILSASNPASRLILFLQYFNDVSTIISLEIYFLRNRRKSFSQIFIITTNKTRQQDFAHANSSLLLTSQMLL